MNCNNEFNYNKILNCNQCFNYTMTSTTTKIRTAPRFQLQQDFNYNATEISTDLRTAIKASTTP